jgi:hypothetical protein
LIAPNLLQIHLYEHQQGPTSSVFGGRAHLMATMETVDLLMPFGSLRGLGRICSFIAQALWPRTKEEVIDVGLGREW